MLRVAPLLMLLLSCFNPDLTGVVFTCSAERPECPAGYSCVEGACKAQGDFAMSPSADATSGAADLVTLDPPDLAKPSGCASGGGQSVGSAWACGESWDFGKINTVCASGFAPCTSMDGVDLSACSKLPRFYVLKLNACLDVSGCASLTPQTIRSCDGNLSGVPRWRFGCGAKLSTVQDCPLPCGGSSQAFRCLNTIGKYACESAASAELDANASNQYGVLCCAKT